MKASTAYNHQRRLLSILRSEFSKTECFCRHHLEHIKAVKENVFEDEGYKKCPNHVKGYIDGYECALWEIFTQTKIIWVLPYNGTNYLKWDNLPKEGKDAFISENLQGKHVHLKNWEKEW